MLKSSREKGNCTFETHIFGNVWLRHVLGFISCARSHVLYKILPKKSRLSCCSAEFQSRYRSLDASYKSSEKGFHVVTLFFFVII